MTPHPPRADAADLEAQGRPPTDHLSSLDPALPSSFDPLGEPWGTPPAGPSPGDTLAGRYVLGGTLGEGGMGTVFRAEQVAPVRRPVAVKVIKAGMDTARVVQRFETERQALAVMDHPHVAKVFDAGTTPAGRPFFVMELVEGEPVTAYCDRRRLGVPDRLRLFADVCRAIHHAHQRGIIHRDVKPSNLLVAECDGVPGPKVIDFGVAKAVTGTDVHDATAPGVLIGTPAYMAPEQATFDPPDTDTRTDVYALGAVLYELLTGSPPVDRKTPGGLAEVLRAVREDDPPRPSTRLSTASDPATVAAARGSDVRRLPRQLRGDLDWVVLKALAKERSRRYESAAALARDIERFLADEPVEARPPSAWYRARKFVRRNRAAVLAAAAGGLAVSAGVAGLAVGLVRADHDRRAAEQALDAATRQQRRAEATAAFMKQTLAGAKPAVARGRDGRLLRDLIDAAAARIDAGELAADPEAAADLRRTIGNVYGDLGAAGPAVTQLRKAAADAATAFGPDDPRTAAAEYDLSARLLQAGEYAASEATADRVLAGCGRRGDGASDVAAAAWGVRGLARYHVAGGVGGDAEDGHRKEVAILKAARPAGDRQTGLALRCLSTALYERRKLAEAEAAAREALDMLRAAAGRRDPDAIFAACVLADALLIRRRPGDAAALLGPVLADAEAVYPADHPGLADVLDRLGQARLQLADAAAAEPLFDRSLSIRRAARPGDHKDVATALEAAGRAKAALDKFAAAEPLLREAVAMRERLFGPAAPAVASALDALGDELRRAGRADDALPILTRALGIWAAAGPDDAAAADTLAGLALIRQDRGEFDKAIDLFGRAVAAQKARHGPSHQAVADALASQGAAYFRAGRKTAAVRVLEEAARTALAAVGRDHPTTAYCHGNLGFVLEDVGRAADAERAYRTAVDGQRAATGPRHPLLARHLTQLVRVLLAEKKWADAEPSLRELLAIREAIEPASWTVPAAKADLGGALLELGKPADAEPLLLAGYAGLSKATDLPVAARPRLAKAAERLARLYAAAGREADAARWRATIPRESAPRPRPAG